MGNLAASAVVFFIFGPFFGWIGLSVLVGISPFGVAESIAAAYVIGGIPAASTGLVYRFFLSPTQPAFVRIVAIPCAVGFLAAFVLTGFELTFGFIGAAAAAPCAHLMAISDRRGGLTVTPTQVWWRSLLAWWPLLAALLGLWFAIERS